MVDLDWPANGSVLSREPKLQEVLDEPSCSFKAPVSILGIHFDPLTTQEAVTQIEAMIVSGRPHQLVTANLDFAVQAVHDVELRRIFNEAHLVLCDGMPLVWASRLLGHPLPERVAGADVVPQLLRLAAEKGYRPFFLGGAPEVAAQAVANLKAQYPNLEVAGHYSPPVQPLLEMDHEEITRRIRAARPDLLFVSLGCPKAEKWLAMHYRALGVPVSVGVGATIDFLAGRVKRAPGWMQRAGIEWIYRLWQEPRRLLKRYATDLWFFVRRLPGQWLHLKCRRSFGDRSQEAGRTVDPVVIAEPGWLRLRMPRCLAEAVVEQNALIWSRALKRHCLLELDEVEFIDAAGVGLLLWLWKQLRADRKELVLLAPSPCVRRALRESRLEDLFFVASDASEARRLIQGNAPESPETSGTRGSGFTQPLLWQGEITASNAEQCWSRMQAQLAALNGHQSNLLVDLSELRFIDSTGLGLLLRAKKEAARRRVELRFINAHANVRNVMRLAQVERILSGPGTGRS